MSGPKLLPFIRRLDGKTYICIDEDSEDGYKRVREQELTPQAMLALIRDLSLGLQDGLK